MLFFEYLKYQIKQEVVVVLKNGIAIKGRLINVDPFLNIKLDCITDYSSEHDFLNIQKGMSKIYKISLRGSGIKCIELTPNGKEELLTDACRIKYDVEI